MDRISAPPQNALLGRLADLLRLAETGAAGGPEFLPKGLDVMNLVRQLALPSAETVEKLSYGDPLFRMAPSGTGSRIPMTTNREYLADVVGMVPIAAPAARPSARGMQELVRQIQTEPPVGAIRPYNKEEIRKIDEEILAAKVPEGTYFHGTDKTFKDFRRKDRGLAYYFTPDPMQAASYSGMDVGANIRPVKLDIKKTYRGGDVDEIMEVVKKEGDYYPYTVSKMREFLEQQDPHAFHTPSVIKALKKLGYDSFVEYEDGIEQIGVFSAKNIKPSFGAGLLDEPAQSVAEAPIQRAFTIVSPGDEVAGLTVREDVPNMSSIGATIENYEILQGIRKVPRKAFDEQYLNSLDPAKLDKRTSDLSEQIKQSKEINPLIVAIDNQGAYIIEGGHRFDALMTQKRESVPAVVVIDKDNPPTEEFLQSLLD